jgi:hypothetical protein
MQVRSTQQGKERWLLIELFRQERNKEKQRFLLG